MRRDAAEIETIQRYFRMNRFFSKEIVKLGQIHRDFIARNCLKNPETHKNSSNNCNKLHIIEAIRSILDHPHMKYAFAC